MSEKDDPPPLGAGAEPKRYEVIPVFPKPQSAIDAQDAMIRHVRRVLETVNWQMVPGMPLGENNKYLAVNNDKLNEWLASHLVGQGIEHAGFRKKLDSFLAAVAAA